MSSRATWHARSRASGCISRQGWGIRQNTAFHVPRSLTRTSKRKYVNFDEHGLELCSHFILISENLWLCSPRAKNYILSSSSTFLLIVTMLSFFRRWAPPPPPYGQTLNASWTYFSWCWSHGRLCACAHCRRREDVQCCRSCLGLDLLIFTADATDSGVCHHSSMSQSDGRSLMSVANAKHTVFNPVRGQPPLNYNHYHHDYQSSAYHAFNSRQLHTQVSWKLATSS